MLRRTLLWFSERPAVFRLLRSSRLAWTFARRFVAGESVADATAAARELAGQDIRATLDLLGESVHAPADAAAATDQVLVMLDRMAQTDGIDVNVSVKLTQLGFDIDEQLCLANIRRILERARTHGGFVRIDMEGSEYTARTLDLFEQRLFPEFGPHVGVVIQSALRRSAEDVERLIRLGARVRLCKGAYLEPESVAYANKGDVDRQYAQLAARLLTAGAYPAIATHDERMIGHAERVVAEHAIPAERFEFQMLYGVRRDLQRRLRDAGYRVRVYIPFGTQWYPYLMRRLAERPANIAFILGNMLRERRSSIRK